MARSITVSLIYLRLQYVNKQKRILSMSSSEGVPAGVPRGIAVGVRSAVHKQ